MTEKPDILKEVDFDFSWDSRKVWELDEPVQDFPIDVLLWHFDYPFLDREGTDDWNLTPKEVLEHPEQHKVHYGKAMKSDLGFPIDVMEHNGRWKILDGLHRLMKAYTLGHKIVRVRTIPRERIPEILRD